MNAIIGNGTTVIFLFKDKNAYILLIEYPYGIIKL